ncbi:MAG TPA: hypothetical protein VL171_02900, partial [Verrucomicrobiae bacterium]|nr:hypothetical protein [Verrucomicrobiae bacterium]
MNAKGLLWCSALATVICATPVFSDTISGSGGAGFQTWAGSNLTENASPYWDNTSMDGLDRNVGFYLVNAPTAPLSNAPGALPYWGNAYNSVLDTGGTADPNFFFQKDATTSTAILQLEVAAFSN